MMPLAFPQPAAQIFRQLVTNNLDRAYRKSKMELCAQNLSHNRAESRRRNPTALNLRLTPYPGIFCPQLLPFQYFAVRSRDLHDSTAIESVFSAPQQKKIADRSDTFTQRRSITLPIAP